MDAPIPSSFTPFIIYAVDFSNGQALFRHWIVTTHLPHVNWYCCPEVARLAFLLPSCHAAKVYAKDHPTMDVGSARYYCQPGSELDPSLCYWGDNRQDATGKPDYTST